LHDLQRAEGMEPFMELFRFRRRQIPTRHAAMTDRESRISLRAASVRKSSWVELQLEHLPLLFQRRRLIG
jgi:hypothetical protein